MIKSDTVKVSALLLAFAFSCLSSPPVFSAANPLSTTSIKAQSTGEELLSLLIEREYGPLNQQLARLQQQYEDDTNAEEALSNAFYVFNSPDPKLSPLLAEWVEHKPDSYAALTAQGLHNLALAWAWRGHETVNKTPPFRMERMLTSAEKQRVQRFRKMEETEDGNGTDTQGGVHAGISGAGSTVV